MTAFIGVGDLSAFLGGATLTTSLADLAVSAAQQRVRRYTDQELTSHLNRVEYLDGTGRGKIRLLERPVRRVISVEESNGGSPTTWTVLAAENYLLRGSVLVRWDGGVWVSGEANIRATYDSGWSVGAIDSDVSDSDFDVSLNSLPADIILATLSLAARMYQAMGSSSGASLGDIKQETIGSYSYTLSSAAEAAAGVQLITAEMAVLDAYKFRGAG